MQQSQTKTRKTDVTKAELNGP